MHIRVLATAATTLLLAGACISVADTEADQPVVVPSTPSARVSTANQEIRVTRDSQRGPQPCRPRQVGETVTGFFNAINRGDAEEAIDYLTSELGWYSITEGNPRDGGRHFVAYNSDELRDYLHRRVSVDERVYLLEIDVDYEPARAIGHVAYSLLRTAEDLTDYAAEAGGKGAIDCDSGRIAVWSMGQGLKPLSVGELCPGEAAPPQLAIACARR